MAQSTQGRETERETLFKCRKDIVGPIRYAPHNPKEAETGFTGGSFRHADLSTGRGRIWGSQSCRGFHVGW